MEDLVEVEVCRLVVQQSDDHQLVHLRVLDGDRSFPIVIGFFEAREMQWKLLGQQAPRPMTHDLIGRLLEATDWHLRRVVVNDLSTGTFFAMLDLVHGDEAKLVDCRPSDAIALAIQLRCPIFVARHVLDEVAPE